MSRVNLKKIILKQGEAAFAIVKLMQSMDSSICIQDEDGKALLGVPSSASKYAIEADDEVVGWVTGESHGAELAYLLTELITKDTEKKSLATEVLGLYREINLLYNLSEKLGTSLELGTVAQTGLNEAHSLIQATHGAVVLTREADPKLESAAMLGDPAQTQVQLNGIEEILRHVIATGKGDINNYVRLDPRYTNRGLPVSALICAPLRAKGQTIGAIALMSDVIITYTAADLKLLNTLASLVGPAIENAQIGRAHV
jgi:transcriptional regulator with GAF, ATPase, and Fis domain